ncbi:bis(5'-nucleosyl)-tetraphosphatase [Thalassoroseus pseudoceratinae]|uniref:bis(5'-nucleosyl)-tetraphosphatase n=1 Tax=Thalassoroseus pseudoceratinae TaxID=2713176 RepID=UPI001420D276|nr:NUDIX domain-containing protein [Thalassoroseus pseudoceratinae]
MPKKPFAKKRSCGVILFRRQPELEFLLMIHPKRLDLPKGHVDPGETDLECALREMEEETGVPRSAVKIDDQFRFEEQYFPPYKRYGEPVEKTLVIYLGWLLEDRPIIVTEHDGHQWLPWNPPHQLQEQTIDPLLAAIAEYFDADED